MTIKEKILSLVSMSEQMLELAESSEWEKLEKLESVRRPEIETFINSLDSDAKQHNSELLKSSIEKILGLDGKVFALAAEHKKNLVGLVQKNTSTHQAMSEYQKNTGL